MVADQTGSGKTLAYLAPLVQRLRYGVVHGAGSEVSFVACFEYLDECSPLRDCGSLSQNPLNYVGFYSGDHASTCWLWCVPHGHGHDHAIEESCFISETAAFFFVVASALRQQRSVVSFDFRVGFGACVHLHAHLSLTCRPADLAVTG